MQKQDTHFAHIWGYGLLVLWCSVGLATLLTQSVTSWPNILNGFGAALFWLFYVGLFAMPIAALLTVCIGGLAWLILKRFNLSNSLSATLAGCISGTLTALPFVIADLANGQTQILYLLLVLALLGICCGWLGERLARRHVKIDPTAIADSFD